MSLSTHILDTSLGRPAAGVLVSLARSNGSEWTLLHEARTDADGRIQSLLPDLHARSVAHTLLRLRFETAPYFAVLGIKSLYAYVDITFTIEDDAHYHIPLLLTANGYTTYRGS